MNVTAPNRAHPSESATHAIHEAQRAERARRLDAWLQARKGDLALLAVGAGIGLMFGLAMAGGVQ